MVVAADYCFLVGLLELTGQFECGIYRAIRES